MYNPKIPYARHNIDSQDKLAVETVLESDWLTTGPIVQEFEKSLESFCGVETAVVSSGTAALHAIFSCLELSSSDEIITPPNTFIATQATAALTGAKIKFADVQLDTGNIDPDCVKNLISPQTKAIVAVDYAGHPADLDELRALADKHQIMLVEDAAHSLGSKYRGRYVGSIADITAFSFFATKNIATGEGGAISSPNKLLMSEVRRFSRQGVIKDPSLFQGENQEPWVYEVHKFGLNYRLPDILCALGLSQLKKILKFKEFRSILFQKYSEELGSYSFVQLPAVREYVDPMWHLYPIRVPANVRKSIYTDLHQAGIYVQVNYLPAYWHPVFDKNIYPKGLCPNAEEFYSQEISLPMFVDPSLLKDEYFERLHKVLSRYA